MGSQTDLDQGGTFRIWEQVYMGPSLGWTKRPVLNTLLIASAGTYILDLSTNVVKVNVVGSVTIILPSVLGSSGGPQAQLGKYVSASVIIEDVGGNANTFPITIQPASVSETIMGLASIQIVSNFGAFTLAPEPSSSQWISVSP
jgi:hypothetical protein